MGFFDKVFNTSDSSSRLGGVYENMKYLDADAQDEITAAVEAEMQALRNKRAADSQNNSIDDGVTLKEEPLNDDFLQELDDPFEIWHKKVSKDPKADCSVEYEAACDHLEWERERLAEWAKKLGVE